MLSLLIAAAVQASPPLLVLEEELPTTLNPLYAESEVDHRTQRLIFEPLWYRHPIAGHYSTHLVSRFEAHDGGRSLHLWIHDQARWQDGQPITGADVCFTVSALLDPDLPLGRYARPHARWLEGCQSEGAWAAIHFDQALPHPREHADFPLLPAHLFPEGPPSPRHASSTEPVGSGLMRGRLLTDRVELEAFDQALEPVSIPSMVLRAEPEAARRTQALLSGEVHGVVHVGPGDWARVARSDQVSLKSYDTRTWWYLAVDTHDPVLADPRVRLALDLVVDARALLLDLEVVHPDDPEPPYRPISGPWVDSSPWYDPHVEVRASDPEQAAHLLREAGLERTSAGWTWQGQAWTLDLLVPPPLEGLLPGVGEALVSQLEAAGLSVALHAQDPGDAQLIVSSASFGLHEEVDHLFSSTSPDNASAWSDPRTDALLQAFREAPDDTGAKAASSALHAHLAQELPVLFLWQADTRRAWSMVVHTNIISPWTCWAALDEWTWVD